MHTLHRWCFCILRTCWKMFWIQCPSPWHLRWRTSPFSRSFWPPIWSTVLSTHGCCRRICNNPWVPSHSWRYPGWPGILQTDFSSETLLQQETMLSPLPSDRMDFAFPCSWWRKWSENAVHKLCWWSDTSDPLLDLVCVIFHFFRRCLCLDTFEQCRILISAEDCGPGGVHPDSWAHAALWGGWVLARQLLEKAKWWFWNIGTSCPWMLVLTNHPIITFSFVGPSTINSFLQKISKT